jgi:hypothetical protein
VLLLRAVSYSLPHQKEFSVMDLMKAESPSIEETEARGVSLPFRGAAGYLRVSKVSQG